RKLAGHAPAAKPQHRAPEPAAEGIAEARCAWRKLGDDRLHSQFLDVRARLIWPRSFFASRRRSRLARVGRVAMRGFGGSSAARISPANRSRASSRLRSWLRKRCAEMTII